MPRARVSTTDRARVAAAADPRRRDRVRERHRLRALARHFGVKDASLYTHVRNLQDLRVRVRALAGGELIDEIAAAVAGRAGKEALAAFAGAYRAYALRHPGRYAATQIRVDQSLVAPTPPPCAAPPRSPTACSVPTAWPNPTSPTRYAMLRSTFHGYCALEAAGGFGAPRDVQASWDKAVDALHVALANWPREPDGSRGHRTRTAARRRAGA
ncbi:WHG domain-containing protein [Streptomyces thinghirensis]|nr:WHG domain-containing protein [Streptomyces thinghirensis]